MAWGFVGSLMSSLRSVFKQVDSCISNVSTLVSSSCFFDLNLFDKMPS